MMLILTISRVARVIVQGISLPVLFLGVLLAHITVRTDNDKAGGHAVYSVRVPNESETGSTCRVVVQIPENLEATRYEPKPGWEINLIDGVLIVESGRLAPRQFTDFRFQARNPQQPGLLRFTAVQTYDDGETVSWTGSPGSETPAPVVEVV